MKTNSFLHHTNAPILTGFLLWLLIIGFQVPYSIFHITHVEILLTAAPLWLIPLVWNIKSEATGKVWLSTVCGISMAIAFLIPKGILSGVLILPWLVFSILKLIPYFKQNSFKNTYKLLNLAAHVFLTVGIFWVLMDRLAIPFLGYDPTIIILTGVHFHYAGFILPMVTAWLIGDRPSVFKKIVSFGIILGIPLVALGISSTHYQWPGWIEVVCVSLMTSAALVVGLLYIQKGFRIKRFTLKVCFMFGGLALITGMVLAFCYGWRHVFVIETLTIPWMYAVHGTCNAVGFAAPVLLGWKFLKSQTLD